MNFIELICLNLLIIGFLNNIKKWERNLFLTVIFGFSLYYCIYVLNLPDDEEICINNKYCFNYYTFVVYFTGLLLWAYETVLNFYCFPTFNESIFYIIHSIIPIGMFFGYIQYWTFSKQILIDTLIISYIIFFCDFNIKKWFLGTEEIEEYLND